MTTINRYVVEDADGQSFDADCWYDSFAEADVVARDRRCRVVEYEFEFSDSSIVADYTNDDEEAE